MSSAMRKAGAVTSLLAATGAAVTIGSVQLASADSATATTGVNIRSGPGTNYAIVGGLVRGQKITAVGKPHSGWIKVRFNGSAAYVSAQYLSMNGKATVPGPANIYTKGVKIATTALNVRQSASLGSKIIGYVADDQKVTLTGKQSRGYAEVLYGGRRAWVSAQYLVSSMNDLPRDTGSRYATADLFIRTTADSNFKIITTVRKGTELQTTGATRNGFAQVVFHNAIRWVTARYLSDRTVSGPVSSTPATSAKPAPARTVRHATKPTRSSAPKIVGSRYATTGLLIRTTSGSDFKTITEVPTGSRLSITGRSANGKAQIIYDGAVRWVTARFLSTSKPRVQNDQPAPTLPKVIGTRYATTALLIRNRSTAAYTTITTVPTGAKLSITGVYENGRAQIVYDHAVRWVTAQYLSKAAPGTTTSSSFVSSPPSSNRGEIALAYAKAQLGKPYVWGAEGPDSFDCSGLTLRAWQAAGVDLPRTSQMQFLASPRVSLNDLRPGDLVFFYGPSPSHVGIYAGNGQVINAPRPGRTVEYTAIAYMPVAGATRPG